MHRPIILKGFDTEGTTKDAGGATLPASGIWSNPQGTVYDAEMRLERIKDDNCMNALAGWPQGYKPLLPLEEYMAANAPWLTIGGLSRWIKDGGSEKQPNSNPDNTGASEAKGNDGNDDVPGSPTTDESAHVENPESDDEDEGSSEGPEDQPQGPQGNNVNEGAGTNDSGAQCIPDMVDKFQQTDPTDGTKGESEGEDSSKSPEDQPQGPQGNNVNEGAGTNDSGAQCKPDMVDKFQQTDPTDGTKGKSEGEASCNKIDSKPPDKTADTDEDADDANNTADTGRKQKQNNGASSHILSPTQNKQIEHQHEEADEDYTTFHCILPLPKGGLTAKPYKRDLVQVQRKVDKNGVILYRHRYCKDSIMS
ncbi:hypothetical protein BgAZ_207990 [Babesia gibsoni]|uniref:Uncharacterized protein n=1 Tax=Babesia gibsoni TaxID=33632 RepID=A0AAD8UUA0_BABGI|nr:hypothetical protein BgAZ_207990 [Babesia gibsoni]